jgi:hypothetical protein
MNLNWLTFNDPFRIGWEFTNVMIQGGIIITNNRIEKNIEPVILCNYKNIFFNQLNIVFTKLMNSITLTFRS